MDEEYVEVTQESQEVEESQEQEEEKVYSGYYHVIRIFEDYIFCLIGGSVRRVDKSLESEAKKVYLEYTINEEGRIVSKDV